MKHYFYKLSFALLVLSLTACVKNTDKDIAPAPTLGTLNLHLHTMLDSLEIETLDSAYALASGQTISVSFAQLYISNVRLVKADGSEMLLEGKPILVTNEQERYNVGQVNAGNYVSAKLDIGLSATINASEPSATDSVLSNPRCVVK